MAAVSASLPMGHRIAAAVLKKAHSQIEATGQAALSLIEGATQTAPRASANPAKGTNLNVVA